MEKVLINITSYNRPKMLNNLLDQLKGVDCFVHDDNSSFNEKDIILYKNHWFKRLDMNFGKKLAWIKFINIFLFCRLYCKEYDYYIFLPDDVKLCDNFVQKAIDLWKSIEDNDKICLSFSNPNRCLKPQFTYVEPKEVGNVILTGWTDLIFICEKRFFEEVDIKPIPSSRWENGYEYLGSGVGSQISNQLVDKGFNLYNVKENLVEHLGNMDSKMNPEIRKIEPL